MKVYIVRHGEVATNAPKIFNTETEDLNEKGIEQAKELREQLENLWTMQGLNDEYIELIDKSAFIVAENQVKDVKIEAEDGAEGAEGEDETEMGVDAVGEAENAGNQEAEEDKKEKKEEEKKDRSQTCLHHKSSKQHLYVCIIGQLSCIQHLYLSVNSTSDVFIPTWTYGYRHQASKHWPEALISLFLM